MVKMIHIATAMAALCASAVGLQWQGLPPQPRQLATIVIDKPRQRAVMFGGGAITQGYSDVWTLGLGARRGYAWESLPTSGPTPGGRVGHTAIYDPVHNWMVVFGGRTGMSTLGDAWALDLTTATWHRLVTSGTPPRGRVYISAVYSPVRRSMVVFGGNDLYTGYNDVNELLLDSMKWRAIAPLGAPPEARWSYNAFYGSGDAWSERLVIFGGQTKHGQFVNDVWTLDLTPGCETWTRLNPGGSIPEGRSNCATGYDSVGRRAYFFGGFNYSRGVYYNDLYMLDMLTLSWTNVNPTGRIPSERRCPAGAYDPWNHNFITFGGQTYSGFTNEWPYIHVGENAARWQGLPPAPRALATIVIDQLGRQAVMFGGAGGQSFNDVWTLALAAERGYAWESLATSGSNPTARSGHTAIYDPVRRQMVIFGGTHGATPLYDVWALDLGTAKWQQLSPTGIPPPDPVYITGVYSPVRRSLVIFGGVVYVQGVYRTNNDVYELLLDSMKWRKLSPAGPRPKERWSYNAFYDSGGEGCKQLVIFGGETQDGQFVNDLWSLDLTPGCEVWQKLNTSNQAPSGRSNCATAFDSVERRAYFFGGFKYAGAFIFYNDLYMLDMLTLSWTDVNPTGRIPSERRCPAGAFDPWNRSFIAFGGETYDGYTNEWPYIYVGEPSNRQGTEPGERPPLQVSAVNPRQASIRFLASGTGAVRVRVLDRSGRVVRNLFSGTLSPGSHEFVWDGTDTRGCAVASGSYFCCLQTVDGQVSRKFVLLR